jgi:hypothetical protein
VAFGQGRSVVDGKPFMLKGLARRRNRPAQGTNAAPREMLARARLDSANRIAPPRVAVNKDLVCGMAGGGSVEHLKFQLNPWMLATTWPS